MKSRKAYCRWADNMRAILILLLVLGHSNNGFVHYVIYWFHMPCFLMLSGYLASEKRLSIDYIKSKISRLLLPYAVYSILIEIFFYRSSPLEAVEYLLYGSGRLRGGVLWYLPSLFLTVVLFSYIKDHIQTKKKMAVLLTILLILSTGESWLFQNVVPPIPWNADVVLIMLFYYGLGYLFRKTGSEEWAENVKIKVPVILFASAAVGFSYLSNIIYMFDMKKVVYDNLVLNVVLPVTGFLLLKWIAISISETKMIWSIAKKIGKNTITIMFLHIPINAVLSSRFHYSDFFYVLIGVLVPLMLKAICLIITKWLCLERIRRVIHLL